MLSKMSHGVTTVVAGEALLAASGIYVTRTSNEADDDLLSIDETLKNRPCVGPRPEATMLSRDTKMFVPTPCDDNFMKGRSA